MNPMRFPRRLLAVVAPLVFLCSVLAVSTPAMAETDPPVIVVTEGGSPLVDGALFGRALVVEIVTTDASPPVAQVVTLNASPFTSGSSVSAEGTYTLVVSATDAVGNQATVTLSFEIDLTAPTFSQLIPADGSVTADAQLLLTGQAEGAESVSVDGQAAALSGGAFVAGPFTLGEGPRLFNLVATDGAGNTTAQSYTIIRDSLAPTLAIAQPAAGAVVATTSLTVTGTASDPSLATVSVNGVVAAINAGSFTAQQVPLAEGVTDLVAVATDAAGNSVSASRSVVLDTQPPSLAITDPATGTVTPEASITVAGTASDPHLARVEINGVAAQLSSGGWSLQVALAEGVNTLTVRALDSLGAVAQQTVSVTRDSTAPAVALELPAEGAQLSVTQVDVSGTVEDEVGVTVTVNAQPATVTAGQFTATTIALVEGRNRLVARATDAQGNQGVHTRYVFRDTVAPELSAVSPADGALAIPVQTRFTLTFSEEMAPPLAAGWRLEAGGVTIPATLSRDGGVWTVTPDSPLSSATSLALVLSAALTDPAGNPLVSPSTFLYTTRDTEPPTAPLLDPLPTALCATGLALSGTTEAGAVVSVTGGAGAAQVRADATGGFTVNLDLIPESLNVLSVTASDRAGNLSASAFAQVVADCQGPEVTSSARQGDDFEVRFSETVASPLAPGGMTLSDDAGPFVGSVQLHADGRGATFAPSSSPLAVPLLLEVSTAVVDQAGNPLAYPYSRLFAAGSVGLDSFLAGTVLDNATGRPLAGARVVLMASAGVASADPRPEQTTTDSGRFQLPVAGGVAELTIVRAGYTPAFRVVGAIAGQGVDLFDPRLTPLAAQVSLTPGVAHTLVGSGASSLSLPATALAQATVASLSQLLEQGLPARLPYGWSPRGAVWLDLAGEPLATDATLSLPVESADGVQLVVVKLDLATLLWQVLDLPTAAGSRVSVVVDGEGAYAAVEADSGVTAPPTAVVGQPLASAPAASGAEVTAAALVFSPEVVLPSQTSRATVSFTTSDVPSGLPLTLVIRELLQLLDGSVRSQAPFEADLTLFKSPDGTPRSSFDLMPSEAAQRLPIELGHEDVTVTAFADDQVAGNVLGVAGGSVTTPEGDRIDVPSGALSEATAITLERRDPTELPLPLPAGVELAGLLSLGLEGGTFAQAASLSLTLSPPPAGSERGLLLSVLDLPIGQFYRPVAQLTATASGWVTTLIDPADLPWPGVESGGLFVFVRLSSDHGYLHGIVNGVTGGWQEGVLVAGSNRPWVQLSGDGGSYVFPALLGSVNLIAQDLGNGNVAFGSAPLALAEERVLLDLALFPVGPSLVSASPADGATEVPAGIEPTLTFSEAVDPATMIAGVRLLRNGQDVPVTFQGQGPLVRISPRSSLVPGEVYEIVVSSALRDLAGNPVNQPFTLSFTVRELQIGDGVARHLIQLVAPDAGGQAQVVGSAGAVPGGATVFVENLTSAAPVLTTIAAANGSFALTLAATLNDELLLHVIPTGGNEIVLKLDAFLSADRLSAWVPGAKVRFTTAEGVTVRVEEGTFDRPTWLRVELDTVVQSPAPVPEGMIPIASFTLDFGGAIASKRLEIHLPAPPGADPVADGPYYFLNRKVEVLGQPSWMMVDLMALDNQAPGGTELTNQLGALAGQSTSGSALSTGTKGHVGGGVLELTKANKASILGNVHLYTPGATFPGQYQVINPAQLFGITAVPLAWNFDVAIFTGISNLVSQFNGLIANLLSADAIWIPARLGQPYTLTVRDLATGYRVYEGTFAAPNDPQTVPFLPPDLSDDGVPPVPVGGDPVRFFHLALGSAGSEALDLGVTAEWGRSNPLAADGTLRITATAGAVDPGVQIKLIGLDDAVSLTTRADTTGAFNLPQQAVIAGRRYLLAMGAIVAPRQPIELRFSEALAAEFPGIDVLNEAGTAVAMEPRALGSRATVRLEPRPTWLGGEALTLRLGTELEDAGGTPWGRTVEIEFKVRASQVATHQPLDFVRDVVRLGSWLFVAAGPDGLLVLDASNPAQLTNPLPGDLTFPFPGGVSVRGVALDSHRRLLVTGGGVDGPGLLRIFDPQDLRAAVEAGETDSTALRDLFFKGSTIVSDQLAVGTGTQLPEGVPRQVTVLNNDDRYRLYDLADPLPSGIVVAPVSPVADGQSVTITLSGQANLGLPVSLINLATGEHVHVDASASDGSFSLQLDAIGGQPIDLLVNVDSLAYAGIAGVGIGVVDINAFYNEDPAAGGPVSDVLGYYTGFFNGEPDPAVVICDQPLGFFGSALSDLAPLVDPANRHPLTLATLLGFHGLMLVEADLSEPVALSFVSSQCSNFGESKVVIGLETVQYYPFDFDDDGQFSQEEYRDYALVGHATEGVLIYDVSDRERPALVGRVPVEGSVAHIAVDRQHRRLAVAGFGQGVWLIDFDTPPSLVEQDEDNDGVDDRVIERIELLGSTNAPLVLVPELGLVFTGGLNHGLSSLAVAAPTVRPVVADGAGGWRPISRLAPYGVVSAPESSAPGAPDQPGAFRLLAALPGSLGETVRLDLVSLTGSGGHSPELGDADAVAGLPRTRLEGDQEGVVFSRGSDDPLQPGFHTYLSEEIVALADPRAARGYLRTADEDDPTDEESCRRCDPAVDGVSTEAREILSGATLALRYPAAVLAKLVPIYGAEALSGAALEIASVRWETAPAVHQEPTLSPSLGNGDVAPGTLLHSGELSRWASDLAIRGRGFDFAFTRTYRNQTVGSGPLGPGWDFTYRKRLRELPNGDVEYYDGRGRRELFKVDNGGPGDAVSYEAPTGRFARLEKNASGWRWVESNQSQMRFDRHGRLVALADAVKDSATTGNEMLFTHDALNQLVRIEETLGRDIRLVYGDATVANGGASAEGRLIRMTDFTGREVRYGYDSSGRLASVRSPEVTVGERRYPQGLTTQYGYAPASGDLAGQLASRDNLVSSTDPRGVEWLSVTYTDANGDGRAEQATGQTWGGDALSISYDFNQKSATVTDRRGNLCSYDHTVSGHLARLEDPTQAAWLWQYNDDGLPTLYTEPKGRVTTWAYDEGGQDRLAQATMISRTVTADSRGSNGSSGSLTTTIEYAHRTHQPTKITDAWGLVTEITRDQSGLVTLVNEASGSAEARSTQYAYNDFGQVVRATNANGHDTEYKYQQTGESKGYLEREIADPGDLNLTTRYEPDSRGRVEAILDRRGVRQERVYNEVDWLVEETQAASGSNDGASSLSYVTRYLHSEVGQLAEVRIPSGVSLDGAFTTDRYLYGDTYELVETHREIGGGLEASTLYTYDKNRNLTQLQEAEGQQTQTVYDPRNLPTSRTRGLGSPEAVTESFVYNEDRELTSRTDGRGHPWTNLYDGFGRLARATNPLGHSRTRAYDDASNVTQTEALASGGILLAKSEQSHDLLNRPTTTTRHLWAGAASGSGVPAGASTTMASVVYKALGQVSSATDAEGRVTQFEYDAAERRTKATDAAGNVTTLTLDAAGNPTTTLTMEVSPTGSVAVSETASYDALNRLSTASDGEGNTSRLSWDARSRRVRMEDPLSQPTTWAYDGLNRLTREALPASIVVITSWDKSSRRVSYQDAAGQTTRWTYDALNRPTGVTYPDATSHLYGYDENNNLVSLSDANTSQVSQTFDPANRRTAVSVILGPGVIGPVAESYTWDGLNRLTQATSGSGLGEVVTALSYDSFSRPLSETTQGRAVGYAYDAMGNTTQLSYPSGLTVAQSFDPLDRLQRVGDQASPEASYSFRGPYRVAGQSLGSSLTGTTSFDDARRPLSRELVTASGTTAFSESHTWTPRGLKAARTRGDLNGVGSYFTYDDAQRLTSSAVAQAPAAALPANSAALPATVTALPTRFSYQYDPQQNLTQLQAVEEDLETEGISTLPSDNRNRPSSLNGVSLTYDANGNQLSLGTRGYQYDFRNRLTRVLEAGVEIAAYRYDAFNRRVESTTSGSVRETVWSAHRELEEYQDGQLAARHTFGRGLDEAVKSETDLNGDGILEQTYLPIYDSSGNLAWARGEDGRALELYRYGPYGERTVFVDLIAPVLGDLTINANTLKLEASEEILLGLLQEAASSNSLRVENLTQGGDVPIVNLSQPITGYGQPRKQTILTLATAPALGDAMRLTIPAEAIEDLFGNTASTAYQENFTWLPDTAGTGGTATTSLSATKATTISGYTTVVDSGPPELFQVLMRGDRLEVELTEEVNLTTAATAITLNGQPTPWQAGATPYKLLTATPLTAGSYTLAVDLDAFVVQSATGSSSQAKAGEKALVTLPFSIAQIPHVETFFRLPDARVIPTSSLGNTRGFHGRPVDVATGLVYFRNRWYSPKMGRFTTPDPLGYIDSPSLYQFAGNDPVNNGDPLGLAARRGSGVSLGESDFWEKAEAGSIYEEQGVFFVVLDDSAEMVPFVRTAKEYFSTTVERVSKTQSFDIVINGTQYGLSLLGIADVLNGSDAVEAKHTTIQGQVMASGKYLAGSGEPMRFFLMNAPGSADARYSAGFGNPPRSAHSAVGGLGPLVINRLPYGSTNLYDSGVAEGAPLTGVPGESYRQSLIQRSNLTFSNQADRSPRTGKVVIAHSSSVGKLLIIVQPDGVRRGVSFQNIRSILSYHGINNAVFLDGSDSVTLFSGGEFVVMPGPDKNESNTLGIGFRMPSRGGQ